MKLTDMFNEAEASTLRSYKNQKKASSPPPQNLRTSRKAPVNNGESPDAAKQAKALGLVHQHWGFYGKDKDGPPVARTVNGVLYKIADPEGTSSDYSQDTPWETEPTAGQGENPNTSPEDRPVQEPPIASAPASPTPTPTQEPVGDEQYISKIMNRLDGDFNKTREVLGRQMDYARQSGDKTKADDAARRLQTLGKMQQNTSGQAGDDVAASQTREENPDIVRQATARLNRANGDVDKANHELYVRMQHADSPEAEKALARIAAEIVKQGNAADAEIKKHLDIIATNKQTKIDASRQKYKLARDNPNKDL